MGGGGPNKPNGAGDCSFPKPPGGNQANPPAVVHAIHPSVAIMNNGARKGGSPNAWQIIKDSPQLEDFWQIHYAMDAGKDHNVPDSFIANVDEHCQRAYLKLTAQSDVSFTASNSRNKFPTLY